MRCVSGVILLRHACRSGDLFVRSCASVRRRECHRFFSAVLMSGAESLSTLLCA